MINDIGNYIEISMFTNFCCYKKGCYEFKNVSFQLGKNSQPQRRGIKEKQAISYGGQIYVQKTGCAHSFEAGNSRHESDAPKAWVSLMQ